MQGLKDLSFLVAKKSPAPTGEGSSREVSSDGAGRKSRSKTLGMTK